MKKTKLAFILIILMISKLLGQSGGEWHSFSFGDCISDIKLHNQTIWAATTDGLVKYDILTGKYDKFNVNNCNNTVTTPFEIAVTDSGTIYVLGNGINRYKNNSFIDLKLYDYFTSSLTSGETLYAGGNFSGVHIITNTGYKNLTTKNSSLPSNSVSSFCQSKDSVIWIGTDNGIMTINKETTTIYNTSNSTLKSNTITALFYDKNSEKVWVGFSDGFGFFENNKFTLIPESLYKSFIPYAKLFVRSICSDPQGKIYIATLQKSLFVYDGTKINHYSLDNERIQYECIDQILFDSKNNSIWMATRSQGLVNFKNGVFKSFSFNSVGFTDASLVHIANLNDGDLVICSGKETAKYNGINWETILDGRADKICNDKNNNYWISGNALTRIKNGIKTEFSVLENNYYLNGITDIIETKTGEIWISNASGLARFRNEKWEIIKRLGPEFKMDFFTSLCEDLSGNIWCGTDRHGLYKFDGLTWTIFDDTNSVLKGYTIADIVVKKDSSLIIGCYYRDNWGKSTIFHYKNKLEKIVDLGTHLNSIYLDKNDIVWYCTNSGAVYFANGNPIEFLQHNTDLINDQVYSMTQDKNGNYWFATSGGISVWNPSKLVSVDDKLIHETPQKFSLKQNYPNPFNPSTKIEYTLSKPGFTSLKIYNILGCEITELVNQYQNAGNYKIDFNAHSFNLPSGIYFYSLRINNKTETKKMILIK